MATLKDLIVQGSSRFIGDAQGSKFILNGGTSSQFLKGDGSVDSSNYFAIGSTEGSASVPSFDSYTDTVHVTSQSLTTAQKTQARTNIDAASTSQLSTFESKTNIVVQSSTATLTAAVGNYYRYDAAVGTLAITLPVPTDTTHLSSIVFAFTTNSSADVTFTSTASIKYQDGFSIDSDTSYEVNAIYNGAYWALAAIILVDTL